MWLEDYNNDFVNMREINPREYTRQQNLIHKTIAVLAGNHQQFVKYLAEQRLLQKLNERITWVAVSNEDYSQLLGRHDIDEVRVIGNFWQRSQAEEIHQLAMASRKVEVLRGPAIADQFPDLHVGESVIPQDAAAIVSAIPQEQLASLTNQQLIETVRNIQNIQAAQAELDDALERRRILQDLSSEEEIVTLNTRMLELRNQQEALTRNHEREANRSLVEEGLRVKTCHPPGYRDGYWYPNGYNELNNGTIVPLGYAERYDITAGIADETRASIATDPSLARRRQLQQIQGFSTSNEQRMHYVDSWQEQEIYAKNRETEIILEELDSEKPIRSIKLKD